MNRLIIFLIRKKLGLKKEQRFYLSNQKNKNDRYFFMDGKLYKHKYYGKNIRSWVKSNISLTFLLSDEIKDLLVKE